jgi:thiol-disulfide isomerase/thioredoxin
MTNEKPSTRKTFWNYLWNALLVVVVLILLIPSWRIAFQGWWQGLFLQEVGLSGDLHSAIPEDAQNWPIFTMESKLINFADLSDKPVILSFWATWCPPCRAELPELQALSEKYMGKIHVIAVSEEPIEVIKESGLSEDYDFLYSTTGIPAWFGVSSYPTLVMIDRGMEMISRHVGAGKLDTEKNRAFLDKLTRE